MRKRLTQLSFCPFGDLRIAWIVLVAIVAAMPAYAQTTRVQGVITQAMQLAPRPAEGERAYVQHCSGCHGRAAQGNVQTVTPALAAQVTSYLIKQLADMADADRQVAEMHRLMARPELSSPQSLRDLSAYLSALPPVSKPEIGDGRRLAVGERIYKTVCRQCHGDNAQGAFREMVPALRGQHYAYLLMQLRQMAVGHRYGVDAEVIELLEALTLDELAAVSDFISRLKPASAEESIASARGSRAMESFVTP